MNDIDLAYVPTAGARTTNRSTARDESGGTVDEHVNTLFESTAPRLTELEVPDFAGRKVWLIGIGGCGMSGLAHMLKRRGALVCGSDMSASTATAALEADGIEVRIGHSAEQLPAPCDLVIASAAI